MINFIFEGFELKDKNHAWYHRKKIFLWRCYVWELWRTKWKYYFVDFQWTNLDNSFGEMSCFVFEFLPHSFFWFWFFQQKYIEWEEEEVERRMRAHKEQQQQQNKSIKKIEKEWKKTRSRITRRKKWRLIKEGRKNLKFDRHNLLMELIVLRVFFFVFSFLSFFYYFLTTHKKMIHNMREEEIKE